MRALFAIWSLVDDDKVEIYSRVRKVTFWIQWLLLFGCVVGFAFYTVFQNEKDSNQLYLLLSLAELSVLLVFALLDFHYCKVIEFFA